MTAEYRRAAIQLADRGKPVFPCRPGGKEPLTSSGFKDATTDRAIVLHWWGRRPDANVGMPTGHASGFLVLDLDGSEGMDTFARLDAHGPGLAGALEVVTGTGLHLYLQMPEADIGISNAALKAQFGPGIDVRGNGGYVIVPPSLHPNGTRYQWGGGQVLPTPDWLVEILTTKPVVAPPARPTATVLPITDDRLLARFNAILERVASEPEGSRNRNKLLHWGACRLRELQEEGAPEGWTELLVQAGVAAGLEEAGTRRSVDSGLRGQAS